jgi:hypothetical protein
VDVDWMILANYAESPMPPSPPIVHMIGAGWDTLHVGGPLPEQPGLPPGTVTLMQGYLAARITFHPTEIDKDRHLRIAVVDEDGTEAGRIEASFRAEKDPTLPPGWDQGVNIVFPLAGMPLVRFGLYSLSLLIDGTHLAERQFRVLKAY